MHSQMKCYVSRNVVYIQCILYVHNLIHITKMYSICDCELPHARIFILKVKPIVENIESMFLFEISNCFSKLIASNPYIYRTLYNQYEQTQEAINDI